MSERLFVQSQLERLILHTSKSKLFILACIALFPSFLKRPCYRLFFRYRIGKRVRVGFSIVDAQECLIEDDARIGHLNLIIGVKRLTIGEHVRIGHLNIIRGGDEVRIGRFCDIIRLNEINSIPDPDVVNAVDPRFLLGEGSIITSGHKIDFTDRVEIGGVPSSAAAILPCGRITGSGRVQSRSGHLPTWGQKFVSRLEDRYRLVVSLG